MIRTPYGYQNGHLREGVPGESCTVLSNEVVFQIFLSEPRRRSRLLNEPTEPSKLLRTESHPIDEHFFRISQQFLRLVIPFELCVLK